MVVEVYVSGTIFKIPNSWMPRVVALLTSLQAFVDVPDDVRVEVKLVSVGPNPIKIIAEIRAITEYLFSISEGVGEGVKVRLGVRVWLEVKVSLDVSVWLDVRV